MKQYGEGYEERKKALQAENFEGDMSKGTCQDREFCSKMQKYSELLSLSWHVLWKEDDGEIINGLSNLIKCISKKMTSSL